jgi:mono/diheme cytochrome c family protein
VAAVAILGLVSLGHAQDDEASLMARGKYLVEGVAGCGNCHTPHNPDGTLNQSMAFAGEFVIKDPPNASKEVGGFVAYAPNITPDKETGIGTWTRAQIIYAIRNGKRPDGSLLGPPMSFEFYRHISDHDVKAIATYIMAQKPIHNVVPKSQYFVPLQPYGPEVTHVPEVPRDDPVRYGEYLAGPLGHCMDCHTPRVMGVLQRNLMGEGGNVYVKPFGFTWTAVSRNLTPNPEQGLGKWTDAEIKTAFTTGVAKDGSKLKAFMPFQLYAHISEQDQNDIVAYLRSLKPLPPPKDKD